ncbi:HEAT repeat domain-containing protein [Aquisalimonas asiatica]|uniref:HEAT repeat-containing protein n=1 Tax=Aquisalimonas asiatica TaxID=406100 RepID=A0A1H8PS07_9GAMM|nr:HEAT repeat domain-containing protein [Aquisalimonas asiatica]SEO44566.1 HEAT repeat-containing protein [Aquisalimonas asiatica]
MDSVIHSDAVVQAAILTGLVLFALTMAIMAQVLWLGISARASEKRQARFLETWRPIMAAAALGDVQQVLPAIHWKDQLRFLLLWNRVQQSVRGQAHTALNQLLYATGMHTVTRLYLEAGSPRARMVAITTMRYLAPPGANRRLLLMARRAPGPVSVAAARTLVTIDPERNMPQLLPILLARRDWSTPHCIDIVNTAGPEAANATLLPAFREGTFAERERLLPLLESTHISQRTRALREFLDEHPDDSLTAQALDLLAVARNPYDTERMRALLDHPQPRVRAIAAQALGHTGAGTDDLQRLQPLLADASWYVRQAAAGGIVALHGLAPEAVEELSHTFPDDYGRQALQRALEARP